MRERERERESFCNTERERERERDFARERERESFLDLFTLKLFFRLVYVSVTIVCVTDSESWAQTALRFSTQSLHTLHEPVSVSHVFLVSVSVAESERHCGGLVALSCALNVVLFGARATPKNEERIIIMHQ